jgi:hypothetical protein
MQKLPSKLKASTALTVAQQQEIAAFQEFGRGETTGHLPPGCEILKFDGQNGRWHTPKGDPDLDLNGEKLIVDVRNAHSGWIKFVNNKVADSYIKKIPEKAGKRDERGDTDRSQWPNGIDGKPSDPWTFSFYLPMITVEGDAYIYICNSVWGSVECRAVISAYANGVASTGKFDRLPLVKLGKVTKENKKVRRRFQAPQLDIIGWRSVERNDDGQIDDIVAPTKKALPSPKAEKAAKKPAKVAEVDFDADEDLED